MDELAYAQQGIKFSMRGKHAQDVRRLRDAVEQQVIVKPLNGEPTNPAETPQPGFPWRAASRESLQSTQRRRQCDQKSPRDDFSSRFHEVIENLVDIARRGRTGYEALHRRRRPRASSIRLQCATIDRPICLRWTSRGHFSARRAGPHRRPHAAVGVGQHESDREGTRSVCLTRCASRGLRPICGAGTARRLGRVSTLRHYAILPAWMTTESDPLVPTAAQVAVLTERILD